MSNAVCGVTDNIFSYRYMHNKGSEFSDFHCSFLCLYILIDGRNVATGLQQGCQMVDTSSEERRNNCIFLK